MPDETIKLHKHTENKWKPEDAHTPCAKQFFVYIETRADWAALLQQCY